VQYHKKERIVSAIPEDNGIIKLSSIDKGRDSASIPMATATSALVGFINIIEPMKAHVKPAIVPSIVLFLLNRNGVFPKMVPKMLAKLSPMVSTAMDVYAITGGKMSNGRIIPKVNAIGAVAKWFFSNIDFEALRVTVENSGNFIPWFLQTSDMV
jgi:hypothetical protein